jgi:hypothetical protein
LPGEAVTEHEFVCSHSLVERALKCPQAYWQEDGGKRVPVAGFKTVSFPVFAAHNAKERLARDRPQDPCCREHGPYQGSLNCAQMWGRKLSHSMTLRMRINDHCLHFSITTTTSKMMLSIVRVGRDSKPI